MTPRENVESIYALTPMQRGMLFHTLYEPGSDVYVTQFDLELRGDLDVQALERAWRALVARHAVLRTSFHWEHVDAPVQIVRRTAETSLDVHDWRNRPAADAAGKVERLRSAERGRGFDLSHAPHTRVVLARLPNDVSRFLWTNHHIILDGWSTGLLARELFATYDGLAFGGLEAADAAPPPAFRDYVAWLQQQDRAAALEYWKTRLSDLDTPPCPIAGPRDGVGDASIGSARRGRASIAFTPEESRAALSLVQRSGVTLSTLMHTAWALVLARHASTRDVLFGTVTAGRPATLPGVESMVGLFINTLPLRVRLQPDEPVAALLRRVQHTTVDMRTFEYLPLADLQRLTRVPAGVPLFDTLFVFENYPVERGLDRIASTIRITRVEADERTSYPLTISVGPATPLAVDARYDGIRVDEAAAHRLLVDLRDVVAAMVAEPDVPFGRLQGFDWNALRDTRPQDRAVPFTTPAPAEGKHPDTAATDAEVLSPIEEVIAAAWTAVLGRARVRRIDNFFALGGHSLLATQLVSRLREAFDLALPITLVFDAPTLAEQAARIDALRKEAAGLRLPPLTHTASAEGRPLSFAQQRLWFLDRAAPGEAAYLMPRALRIEGDLDYAALRRTFEALAARHDTLRTRFVERDGAPVQIVEPAIALAVPVIDLSTLDEPRRDAMLQKIARREAVRPFALDRAPLLRVTLVTLGPRDHALLLTMHHIISDGWSMGVLLRDLLASYEACTAGRPAPLAALPVQYADVAAWQRQWLAGDLLEQHLRYWRETLADAPALDLPLDRPRPAAQSYQGDAWRFVLPAGLRDAALALAGRERCTLFMVLLAAWEAMLGRYARQQDFCLGTPIANRQAGSTEEIIGFFVNMLVLRADLSGDPSFVAHLRRVRQQCLHAYTHQDLPFEKLVEELQPARDPRRHPLFQVVFAMQNAPMPALELPGLTFSPLHVPIEATRFDLELHATEEDGQIACTLIYNTSLFTAETVRHMAEAFRTLLTFGLARPKLPISQLRLLPPGREAEVTRLLERQTGKPVAADATADGPTAARRDTSSPRTLHDALASVAAQRPQAAAVIFGEHTLTYADLDGRSARLAARLREAGVSLESRVGLCLERSDELIVSLIAILRANGAYVPLDPEYPHERLSFMAADAGVAFVIASPETAARLSGAGVRVVTLEDLEARATPASAAVQEDGVASHPRQAAYVIYTSGSTGQPKGTVVTHDNVLRLFETTHRWFEFQSDDVWVLFHSCAFDFSVWEMWGALLHGGTLVVAPASVARSPRAFHDLLTRQRVTVLNQTPSAFYQLMATMDEHVLAPLANLRLIIFGGEALDTARLKPWCARHADDRPRLVNMYGITETTVHVTFQPLSSDDAAAPSSPIGRPLPDLDIYLLDDHQMPVPPGMAGEIYVGGAGLARGYLHRPDLTAARFLPHPFAHTPGERLYRSGDLARVQADGTLAFVGRSDHQVKIRGYRIELPEIEAHLRQHSSVQDAVVRVRNREDGTRDLIAYVVPRRSMAASSREADTALIREWQAVFDQTYQCESAEFAPTFNIAGWKDSYTGQPIPADEMREWVDATVRRIASLRTRPRILEIGCGTGLLLHRLAPLSDGYIGTDASAQAIALLTPQVAGAPHVRLLHRAAHDFDGIEPACADVVVLNSVAQYFPSIEYLARVLGGACTAAKPGGAIFIGDIRHFELLDALHGGRLADREPGLARDALAQRIRLAIAAEEELVLSPAAVAGLARELEGVERVEVYVKRGQAHNELTRYRYDVVLRLAPAPPETAFDADCDWVRDGVDLEWLRTRLPQVRSLRLRHVPNARLTRDRALRAWLYATGPQEPLARVLDRRASGDVDPESVCTLAEQLGFTAAITYATDDPCSVDILLGRGEDEISVSWGSSAAEREPRRDEIAERESETPMAGATRPHEAWIARQLGRDLRTDLRSHVPDYMVPAHIIVLDALPLTAHGKLDARKLPEPDAGRPATAGYVAPSTPAEQVVARIWSELLGIDRVGLGDRFLDLGGHSLLAVRAISRLSAAFQVDVPLAAMLDNPSVATLVERLAPLWNGRDVLDEVARTLLEIESAERGDRVPA